MNQKSKEHISPWIAWALVALMTGIAGFCLWYYYDQITSTYDNIIATGSIRRNIPTTATADWKTYENDTYGFSIKYPDPWKIDSAQHIDKTSPVQIEKSSVDFTIYQGEEDNMTKKLEISFLATDKDLAGLITEKTASEKYKELGRFSTNGITWSYGQVPSYNGDIYDIFVALSAIDKTYSQTNIKKIKINAGGYVFTGPESSKYTGEDSKTFRDILSTFQFTP